MSTHLAIKSNDLHQLILTWKDLYNAKFAFIPPFCLKLIENQELYVEKVVRFAPKRRVVVFGQWEGKSVAAKLFIKPRNAKLKMKKDSAGIKILQSQNIATPDIYSESSCCDKRMYVLLFERIMNAKPLEKIWRDKKSAESLLPQLKLLLNELASQHVLGILQRDMNLKNYLFHDMKIYSIDGTGIVSFSGAISKKESINNLASFFSYLGIECQLYAEDLFHYYAKLREWKIEQKDILKLLQLIDQKNLQRWQRNKKKIFSESSHFSYFQEGHLVGMFNRSYALPEFIHFIKNPDIVFEMSKINNIANNIISTTKVRLDKREFIIKSYAKHDRQHINNHFYRKTPARESWYLSHKLNSFGILTENPVAFIENIHLGHEAQSYYIAECALGDDLLSYLQNHKKSELTLYIIDRTIQLLKNIYQLGISYDDLKEKTILINANEQLVIADSMSGFKNILLFLMENHELHREHHFIDEFINKPHE